MTICFVIVNINIRLFSDFSDEYIKLPDTSHMKFIASLHVLWSVHAPLQCLFETHAIPAKVGCF